MPTLTGQPDPGSDLATGDMARLAHTVGGDATADSFTVSPPDLERLIRQFDTIERHAVAIDEEEPAGQPVAFY